jgi:hypothetical protein
VRPRRAAARIEQPCNASVRPTSVSSRRLVEIVLGLALVGYFVYAISSGLVLGRTRSYSRQQDPWRYWAIVLVGLSCGVAFLLGAVSWRA